jgi:hypothetical protein
MYFNIRTYENIPSYIICDMRFKDKTYGLNLGYVLVANWIVTIERFSHMLFVCFTLCKPYN